MSSASVGMSMLCLSLVGHGEISGPGRQMTVGWTERWGKRIFFGAFWCIVHVMVIVCCAETSALILEDQNAYSKVISVLPCPYRSCVVRVVFTKGISSTGFPALFALTKHVPFLPSQDLLSLFGIKNLVYEEGFPCILLPLYSDPTLQSSVSFSFHPFQQMNLLNPVRQEIQSDAHSYGHRSPVRAFLCHPGLLGSNKFFALGNGRSLQKVIWGSFELRGRWISPFIALFTNSLFLPFCSKTSVSLQKYLRLRAKPLNLSLEL